MPTNERAGAAGGSQTARNYANALKPDEWLKYLADARLTDRDEALLIDHLTATGNLPDKWITHRVDLQAEC